MDKQVYELTADDFAQYGAWFFPMDDSAEDELTVRPIGKEDVCSDFQAVIRTRFCCANGKEYIGYLYWDANASVEYLKPVMFMDDGTCLCFWNGIVKPVWEKHPGIFDFMSSNFPISFVSEPLFAMPSITGELEGLYYLSDAGVSIVFFS